MSEQQDIAEKNAIAWLVLTDIELAERSASLGLDGGLVYGDPYERLAGRFTPDMITAAQLVEARKAADDAARSHVGDTFVDDWISQHRT